MTDIDNLDPSLENPPQAPNVISPGNGGGLPTPIGPLPGDPAPSNQSSQATPPPMPEPPKSPSFLVKTLAKINVYSLLFVLIIVVAAGVVLLTLKGGKGNNNPSTDKVSSLTDSELSSLKGATTVVGTKKQTLDVQSDSIFEGQILARSDLDVAGNIKVGGSLNLPSLNVSGNTSTSGLQVGNDLKVAGAMDVQGQTTLHKGLSVAGAASFGNLTAGALTITSLQLNGDLSVNRHITSSGGAPSRSAGTALGSGGTASVNGNDTAGTVNINTGSSPAAGTFINVTFTHAFTRTPHVLITPIGSAAGSIPYYVNRTATGFSIGTTSPAAANKSFAFDYFVIQ